MTQKPGIRNPIFDIFRAEFEKRAILAGLKHPWGHGETERGREGQRETERDASVRLRGFGRESTVPVAKL